MSSGRPARTGSSSRKKENQIEPCKACSVMITDINPHLYCATCRCRFHTSCLSEWKSITKLAELSFFEKRGVLWYCDPCLAKLPDYFYSPTISNDMQTLQGEVKEIRNLLCENIQAFRDKPPVPEKPGPTEQSSSIESTINEQIKLIKEQTKAIQKQNDTHTEEVRNRSAVINNIDENEYLEDHILRVMHELAFHMRSVHQFSRIGRQSRHKNRPVKLLFASEVMKNDFLWRFNNWQRRGNCFARPDLSPEQREAEYKLRVKKRELEGQNPGSKYRIRGSNIYKVPDRSGNRQQHTSHADTPPSTEAHGPGEHPPTETPESNTSTSASSKTDEQPIIQTPHNGEEPNTTGNNQQNGL